MPKQKQTSKATQARRSGVGTPQGITIPEVRTVTRLQYMSRNMQKALSAITEKLTQLENKINTPATGSSTGTDTNSQGGAVSSPIPVATPGPATICYAMPPPAAERPKFPVKNKHPVTFIEDLTAYLRKCPPGASEGGIDAIIECLEGEARDWARLYRDRWSQLDDFKKDFLDTYWGEAEQSALRRKIVHNTWNESQSTMLGHFISLSGQAKMLTYPIQEPQLVSDIMNHFPRDVQYSWSTSNYTTILQATEFLRKLDNVNKQTSLKNVTSNTSNMQKPAMGVQGQHDRRNQYPRQHQVNNRAACQVNSTIVKPSETNVVSIVNNSDNTSAQNSLETNNLNE